MSSEQKNKPPHDAVMASSHLAERREVRYTISFDIEVSGIDRHGQAYHEKTVTLNVSEWGCAFSFPIELRKDDVVTIRVMPSDDTKRAVPGDPAYFQVVRVSQEKSHWLIGVWKIEGRDPWGADLEALAAAEEGCLECRADTKPDSE